MANGTGNTDSTPEMRSELKSGHGAGDTSPTPGPLPDSREDLKIKILRLEIRKLKFGLYLAGVAVFISILTAWRQWSVPDLDKMILENQKIELGNQIVILEEKKEEAQKTFGKQEIERNQLITKMKREITHSSHWSLPRPELIINKPKPGAKITKKSTAPTTKRTVMGEMRCR